MIRVSPDELRNAAQQQGEIFNHMHEAAEKLENLSGQLSDAWSGVSGNQARDSLREILADFRKLLDGSEDDMRKLVEIANAFENVDGGDNAIAARVDFLTASLVPRIFHIVGASPGYVRIDTDQVRDIAAQCRHVANQVAESEEAFAGTLKTLQNEWEGRSAARYLEETQTVRQALLQIRDNTFEFADMIMRAANQYDEIDGSLA